jgi:predicted RNA binding protein YcfA (HicA-like mRNA interferase family)
MPRLPRVTARQVIRVLQKMGWILDRQTGGHRIFTDTQGRWTTVPYHAGKTLHPKVLKSILADIDLTVAEFARMLKGP